MVIIKQDLFLDYDNTIVNSTKQIVSLYDKDFHLYRDYKKINWEDINHYDFRELTLINKSMVLDYFDDHRFFEYVEFMENAEEVMIELSNSYNIIICSIGRSRNLQLKRRHIEKYIPYADFIGIDYDKLNDKRHIDMSGCIFIDDLSKNLINSNCRLPICFGKEYSWNKDWGDRLRCYNFEEVKNLLL